MANGDSKAWNIANLVIVGMAGIIAVLVGIGYASLGNKIDVGDASIHGRLSKIEDYQKTSVEIMGKVREDITRIDVLQKLRIEREHREEGRKYPR